jgi:hypothetical protein
MMSYMQQKKKYERPYDIVNLHENFSEKQCKDEGVNKKLGPLRNAYNIINNQRLPEIYFKNR